MSVLTDVTSVVIKENVKTIYGKTLTQPRLMVSDGISTTYACDVDIAQYDPTNRIDQYYFDTRGLPHQPGWKLEDSLTIGTVLHNVSVARGNANLIYANIGSPVRLDRNESGQWQITGFSIEQPGTYLLIPVDLGDMTIGPIIDLSIDGRLLTLGELGTLAPFGTIVFGASGIFVGGTLIRIV